MPTWSRKPEECLRSRSHDKSRTDHARKAVDELQAHAKQNANHGGQNRRIVQRGERRYDELCRGGAQVEQTNRRAERPVAHQERQVFTTLEALHHVITNNGLNVAWSATDQVVGNRNKRRQLLRVELQVVERLLAGLDIIQLTLIGSNRPAGQAGDRKVAHRHLVNRRFKTANDSLGT